MKVVLKKKRKRTTNLINNNHNDVIKTQRYIIRYALLMQHEFYLEISGFRDMGLNGCQPLLAVAPQNYYHRRYRGSGFGSRIASRGLFLFVMYVFCRSRLSLSHTHVTRVYHCVERGRPIYFVSFLPGIYNYIINSFWGDRDSTSFIIYNTTKIRSYVRK